MHADRRSFLGALLALPVVVQEPAPGPVTSPAPNRDRMFYSWRDATTGREGCMLCGVDHRNEGEAGWLFHGLVQRRPGAYGPRAYAQLKEAWAEGLILKL